MRCSLIHFFRLLPAQGNGQVEDGEHNGAFIIGEQISYDGGGDGGVAGLSNPHQASGEHKEPVVLHRGDHRKSDNKMERSARNTETLEEISLFEAYL